MPGQLSSLELLESNLCILQRALETQKEEELILGSQSGTEGKSRLPGLKASFASLSLDRSFRLSRELLEDIGGSSPGQSQIMQAASHLISSQGQLWEDDTTPLCSSSEDPALTNSFLSLCPLHYTKFQPMDVILVVVSYLELGNYKYPLIFELTHLDISPIYLDASLKYRCTLNYLN